MTDLARIELVYLDPESFVNSRDYEDEDLRDYDDDDACYERYERNRKD